MRLQANDITVEVEDQGPADGEPLLLLMGLGMQLSNWPPELLQQLAARGFRVLRMDNRDAGLSQSFDSFGVPSVPWAVLRHAMHLPVSAPYGITHMAADVVGVLDALGLQRVHLCGVSLGGMIAQHVAARHPQRVKSLTLMMTTSGSRRLPQPSWRMRRVFLWRPAGDSEEAIVDHVQRVLRAIGSPAFPADRQLERQRLLAAVRRAWRPAGTSRQLLAVLADGDRLALLPRITAPTRIIHGEVDPLVPVAAGRELQACIRGAQGDFIAGMGHDLPLQLLPRFADGIAAAAERAR